MAHNRYVVLLIEDDADIRDSVADILDHRGYSVLCADSGRAALELLSRNLAPNVILLDMMMPEMDGWTFLGELRKDPLLSHVPVAVFTAHGDADDIAESVQAAACLKKPPTMEELLTTVEHLTAGQPPRP